MVKSHIVFFPGMIVHELAHYLACVLLGVRVSRVKLFDAFEAFVVHEKPGAWKSLIITIAPFILNTVIALELMRFGLILLENWNPIGFFLWWFALALLFFCFPSKADSQNAFYSFTDFYDRHILKRGPIFSRIFWLITFPFVFIPLIIILGILLAFNSFAPLRYLFIILLVIFSIQQTAFFLIMDWFGKTLSNLIQAILWAA